VPDEVALYRIRRRTDGWFPCARRDCGINTVGQLQVNEHAQPRQWLPGGLAGSTLQHYLAQIAARHSPVTCRCLLTS